MIRLVKMILQFPSNYKHDRMLALLFLGSKSYLLCASVVSLYLGLLDAGLTGDILSGIGGAGPGARPAPGPLWC